MRVFRAILGALIGGALLASCNVETPPSADAKAAGFATAGARASQVYWPVRRCMQFANALDAPREGEWGYRIRDTDIRAVAAAGFDTIRVPIQWSAYAAEAPPYTLDPAIFARADHVFRLAMDQNLNVIFTVHNYEAMNTDPGRASATDFWRSGIRSRAIMQPGRRSSSLNLSTSRTPASSGKLGSASQTISWPPSAPLTRRAR